MVSRCSWALGNELMVEYHDNQWGKPSHDDRLLFEMLCLEGMQAGLSWLTILKKRENYKEAFDDFDIEKISKYNDSKIEELSQNEGIIRNRLKINSIKTNAIATKSIIDEFGSLDKYIWSFVDNKPIVNHYKPNEQNPATSDISDKMSKDMKNRGFKFVGSTIIYAFMQAAGLVNDHTNNCDFK